MSMYSGTVAQSDLIQPGSVTFAKPNLSEGNLTLSSSRVKRLKGLHCFSHQLQVHIFGFVCHQTCNLSSLSAMALFWLGCCLWLVLQLCSCILGKHEHESMQLIMQHVKNTVHHHGPPHPQYVQSSQSAVRPQFNTNAFFLTHSHSLTVQFNPPALELPTLKGKEECTARTRTRTVELSDVSANVLPTDS